MSRLKKTLLIFLSIIAGVFLLMVIAAAILAPRIKEIVVQQINNNLAVPVKVDEIDFSLIKHFPYASVDFSGVSTPGIKLEDVHQPLLNAEHVFLMFNLFNVFSDDLHLKKIAITNAKVICYVDKDGNTNYDIFKKKKNSSGNFNLALEEVSLENTGFIFISQTAERDYRFQTKKLTLSGNFSSDIYDLKSKGQLFIEKFKIADINYIDHKETEIDLSLMINSSKNTYDIREAHLQVADLKLDVTGSVNNDKPGADINLNVKSDKAGLKELLSLIPGVYTERLQQYRYNGEVYFNMQIKGLSDKDHTPLVTADFGAESASLKPKASDYELSNIRFKGNYTSRISASHPVARIQLKGLEARLEGQPLRASLLVEDFANPYLELTAHSKINLEVLSRFYMPDTLESINGIMQVDASIKGYSKNQNSWISSGTLIAENAAFKIKGKDINFNGFNGRFNLNGNQLTVTDFRGNAEGSDFMMQGTLSNVLGYLLSKEEKLSGNISVNSRNIDLNELLEDKKTSSVADTNYRLDFSSRIDLTMQVNIGILSFRKFQAWQVKGSVALQNKILNTSNLTFKACDGTFQIEGRMDASRNDSILIAYDANIKSIDITELFSQMGNFGQEVLVDKNVKGQLTASVQFASTWSKSLHCNLDRIYAKSDLTIENGELNNFEPMLALNRYLKGADLMKVKFKTLRNKIEIKNQTIFIPSMQIQSSAMDITASGTHTFDNYVDYQIQLLFSQLMGKKVKEQRTEFGTIEDDGLGRFKLFLSMKGPLKNPKITYDRKGIEQKITHDIKQEKQNIKGILKEEFGWFKKDSVKKANTSPKPKQQELQLETDD